MRLLSSGKKEIEFTVAEAFPLVCSVSSGEPERKVLRKQRVCDDIVAGGGRGCEEKSPLDRAGVADAPCPAPGDSLREQQGLQVQLEQHGFKDLQRQVGHSGPCLATSARLSSDPA